MSAIKIALRQSQKTGRRKTSEAMSAEVSPDSKCPICLDIFNNISYLDICLHKFCFRCIHEWSKNKAECPLCKQPFNSIYHSIKSEQDYKKYDLQPIENGSFGSFGGVRFRYRTTLTGVHRQIQRRTSPPPDNGVMFEGSVNPPLQRQDRYIRRMMMRLAAKRRAANEGRAVHSVREQEMINFRRELYRQGVRVRSVRDGGRSRDTSAEFYRRNPACLHRLVPWLKRELMVLYGAHGSLVNIVQHIIMSRITRYDMEDGPIQEELRPFLQGRTEHFLHEFISFAKSPFNMEAYDQHAVYDCPAPSSNEDSSTNSSVIAISEDELNSLEFDPTGDSLSGLSNSVWDDETPGPSYSTTAEQSRAERLSVPDSDSDTSLEDETREYGVSPQHTSPHLQTDLTQVKVKHDECLSSDSDDCLIVGFVKPTAERTPELVQLSSDSEESANSDTKVPHLPHHIRFTSLSPQSSQRGDPDGPGQSKNMEREHNHQSNSIDRCSSSTSRRPKTSDTFERKNRDHHDRRFYNDSSKERHRSRNRDHRSRKSKSREFSKSPVISHSNGSTLSRDKRHSYSRRGRDSDFRQNTPAYSYYSHSYRHYSREKDDTGRCYSEKRSYYNSSHKYSERYSYSHSRSRSRELNQQDEAFRQSRSRTYSSSCSPSAKKSYHEKPGGKRKYKTRHLEEASKNSPSKSFSEADSSTLTKHKKRSKEKHKKSKEMSRKTSRSLSVEIVNKERNSERSKRHHKKKKKHKKKSKRHKSKERTAKCSPTVITIDSDSDANDSVIQARSTNEDNLINSITDDPVDFNPVL